tara:strand:- start:266 stop:694 length:429 start_codon:yes stop_codon:yes gene_type:complete
MPTRQRPFTFMVLGEFRPQPELFPQGITHGYVYLIPQNPSAKKVFGNKYMCLPITQDSEGNYVLSTVSATTGMRSAKAASVERIAKDLGDLFTKNPIGCEINLKRSCILGTNQRSPPIKKRSSGPQHLWKKEIAESTRASMT